MLALWFASGACFASRGVANLVFFQFTSVSVKTPKSGKEAFFVNGIGGVKTAYWELNVETDGVEGMCVNKC